jgi:hypothetical protein
MQVTVERLRSQLVLIGLRPSFDTRRPGVTPDQGQIRRLFYVRRFVVLDVSFSQSFKPLAPGLLFFGMRRNTCAIGNSLPFLP